MSISGLERILLEHASRREVYDDPDSRPVIAELYRRMHHEDEWIEAVWDGGQLLPFVVHIREPGRWVLEDAD